MKSHGFYSKSDRKPMGIQSREVTRYELCFNRISLAAALRKTSSKARTAGSLGQGSANHGQGAKASRAQNIV